MNPHGLLFQSVVYLAAAVIAVPLFKRLGLGSVIGYLFAGMVIGPFGLKLIGSVEDVMHFAEFGVVLLLFLIGLELNPKKLWRLRKPLLGAGSAQVLLTTAVFAGLGILFGLSWPLSILAAMGFSLSSTAIGLQVLREKNLLHSGGGQTSFAVLLFQDLAVIPMLAVLPLLSVATGNAPGSQGVMIAKSVAAIILIIVLGRTVIRPIFRYIARTNLREIFTAFSLFLVVGIAALMEAVGLSMALGSFLAGVLLAESEYRHALEVDIEPFKGLLLGLFFIAVGMSVDFQVLLKMPGFIAALVFALVGLKTLILLSIARFFDLPKRDRAIFALTLSQGGEFAFVLFNLGLERQMVSPEHAAILILVVALSMLTTPIFMIVNERWLERRYNREPKREHDTIEPQNNPVIIAGYGRVGQIIGRLLQARGIETTILDHDANQVDMVRKFGWQAYYGDVTRVDLLRAAGAERAKLLILAIDDMEATLKTIALAREHFPTLKILARARSRTDAYRFIDEGVAPVRETLGSSLILAEEALKVMGASAFEAHQMTLQFQDYDEQLLLKDAKHRNDIQTLIHIAQENRDALTRLMQEDEHRLKSWSTKGWN